VWLASFGGQDYATRRFLCRNPELHKKGMSHLAVSGKFPEMHRIQRKQMA